MLYPVLSIKKYCQESNNYYHIFYPQQKATVYKVFYLGDKVRRTIKVNQPEMYVAEITNAAVCGANSFIITKDNRCLLDSATRFGSNRLDFTYGPVKYIRDFKASIDIPEINKQAINQGIMLNGIASYNYYHWLLEFLPRMEFINSSDKYRKIPLLVDEEAFHNIPQLEEAIKILNIHNNPFYYLKPHQFYKVKKLIIPSYTSWNTINLKKGIKIKNTDSIIPIQSIDFLKKSFLKYVPQNKKAKKIYISRLGSKIRNFNQEEVEKIFIKSGFEIVHMENMTFLDQVEICSKAKVIAGAIGAGMANMIFAQTDTYIICLINQKMNFTYFSNLAGINKLKAIFIPGVPNKGSNYWYYQQDFTIDPSFLEKTLKLLNN